MIGRFEQHFNYSLVEDYITSDPSGVPLLVSKYNISFAILLLTYLIFRKSISWIHLGIIAIISVPFCLSEQLLYETFAPQANNPQVPHFVLLLVSFTILLVLAVYRPTRTMERIFGALIGFSAIASLLLIHTATINIKLTESRNMQESSHMAVFDATMIRDDKLTFLDYCKAESIKCFTALPNEAERSKLYTLLGNQAEYTFGIMDKGENYTYLNAFSLNDEHGAFLFMYGKMNGMIRIIVDQDNVKQFHLSALKVMYCWFAFVSSFWIYGGLYVYWRHTGGRRIRNIF